ncbi:hypothetical protein [Hathewaya massiliensis]|uniref:hypothetical protein n=1 Tax=Hathewaya massiliensis TaxID=1964382 RepID=UPI0011591E75|nr:hypothetical protein [Hathewaya massiliensis]
MGIKKDNQKINNVKHKKLDHSEKEKSSNKTNYKKDYDELVLRIKEEVTKINASDYSKKSLGKFKEKIEKILDSCMYKK